MGDLCCRGVLQCFKEHWKHLKRSRMIAKQNSFFKKLQIKLGKKLAASSDMEREKKFSIKKAISRHNKQQSFWVRLLFWMWNEMRNNRHGGSCSFCSCCDCCCGCFFCCCSFYCCCHAQCCCYFYCCISCCWKTVEEIVGPSAVVGKLLS